MAIPYAERDPHSRRLYDLCDLGRYALAEARVLAARRAYYGAISYLDDKVGALVAALGPILLGLALVRARPRARGREGSRARPRGVCARRTARGVMPPMQLGLNARRIVVACALAAALAACSARPFPVSAPKSLTRALEPEREAAAEAARPAPRIVAICYGNLLNTPEEVLEEARYECRDGEVTFQDADLFWTPCGLLQPVRASFLCTPRPEPAE